MKEDAKRFLAPQAENAGSIPVARSTGPTTFARSNIKLADIATVQTPFRRHEKRSIVDITIGSRHGSSASKLSFLQTRW